MLKFKNVKINLINFFSILKSFNSSQFILNDFFLNLKQLTITTTDRRKNPLSIKVNLVDMGPSSPLLVDFRLSKVCYKYENSFICFVDL